MGKMVSAGTLVVALTGLLLAGCGGSGGGGTIGTANTNPATYKISGSVTASGSGLAGATVLLGGAGSASAVTDVFGNYSFSRLANGSYTVTPVKSDYRCTPRASAQTVKGVSLSGVNFTAAASSPVCYLVDDAGNLGTLDITSGNVQVIGNTGLLLTDIAFDQNGTLYGVLEGTLYRIDKTTAQATAVGVMHISGSTQTITGANSLEVGNNGTLYTATTSLYAVDPATGVAISIGNGGSTYNSSGDLAFIGNKMYLTSKTGANVLTNTDLFRIDTSTGQGTRIGSVGYPFVFGLTSNDNVHLYGFTQSLAVTIDPTTGAGAPLFDLSGKGLGNINGAAFE